MTGEAHDRSLAVVTGASSGIGLELARQFAEHDFDLLIAAEDDGIRRAAEDLGSGDTAVETAQVDLATREGVEQLYQRIQALGRPVDALALNAGVGVNGPFLESNLEDQIRLIGLNVASVVHLSKLVIRDMVSRGEGRVLITSSIAADMPGSYSATYNASKAFDLSFAEALRHELKDTGVTVTALQPGATDTNFFKRSGAEDQNTKLAESNKDDPAEVAKEGFEALMAGKDHVVAGSFKNRVQDAMAQVLPETTKAKLHAKQAKPSSGGPAPLSRRPGPCASSSSSRIAAFSAPPNPPPSASWRTRGSCGWCSPRPAAASNCPPPSATRWRSSCSPRIEPLRPISRSSCPRSAG
jgi:short-subunit dehydrogenase